MSPSPGDIWQLFGDVFGQNWGKGVLVASGRWRPGMLLNILECTGQFPQQRIIWANVNSGVSEKPYIKVSTYSPMAFQKIIARSSS